MVFGCSTVSPRRQKSAPWHTAVTHKKKQFQSLIDLHTGGRFQFNTNALPVTTHQLPPGQSPGVASFNCVATEMQWEAKSPLIFQVAIPIDMLSIS